MSFCCSTKTSPFHHAPTKRQQLEGSSKSAGVLFFRYDMDLDGLHRIQDLYGE